MENVVKPLPITAYVIEVNQIKRFLETKVYPYNPDLAELWMKSPNSDFEGMSPSEVIFKHGMKGIERVRDYLTYHVQGEI